MPGPEDWFSQDGFALRFDWGLDGWHRVRRGVAVVVVVDVLRFTTAVAVAIGRGAVVLPFPWADRAGARALADSRGAELAGHREDGAWSLSPSDLLAIPAATRLVLPSPNGSAIAHAAADDGAVVLAGCLRNGPAVGAAARRIAGAGAVAVIAAGEMHAVDAAVRRPAVEDMLGAGAVLSAAGKAADRSPEAGAAVAAFGTVDDLEQALATCASGRELVDRGWADDVRTAAQFGADSAVPILRDGEFVGLGTLRMNT